MNILPTRLLVVAAMFVTITIMKYAIQFGGGSMYQGGNRVDDIERFHLLGGEVASYDACRAALGRTQGMVGAGEYCGCLVVGGATNMHDVTVDSLKPVVVANFTSAPSPGSVKDAAMLRVVNLIEVAGSTCRHPHRERASAGGANYEDAVEQYREMQRQIYEDARRRSLPLVTR